MKKAILFDLDGVLLDSMPFHVKAWQEIFSQFDIQIEPGDIYEREGTRTVDLAGKLAKSFHLNFSAEELQKLAQKKSKLYNEITGAGVMPGAAELIDELKRKGVYIAIVTSTFRENLVKVMPNELLSQFKVIITGEDVIHGKPHPEPYLTAAKKLGLSPAECIVIENAALGVESGKAAGMFCIGITSTQSEDQLINADRIMPDLIAVLEQVDSILNED